MKMRALDLFSGIGGISLALKDFCKVQAYVEIDDYCQAVLRSRIAEGKLDNAEIYSDVKKFKTEKEIDIIYGGFPCQGISVAGLGKGLEDELAEERKCE